MSKIVSRNFPAQTLMEGMRSIGYNFSTAVADIIDNSLSARSTEINVYSDPLAKEPYFCVLDNGCGMDAKELDNAMLPGSDRTQKRDSETELGRFGLGLKSASLSQCREFIVISKKNGCINGMAFDLDIITNEEGLRLKVLDDEEISQQVYVNNLIAQDSGTLVIWNKFDKLLNSSKNFEESFRSIVADAKKHIELVFHRFYDTVSIFFDGRRVEERDPFLLESHGRQQTGRTTTIDVEGSVITVIPYSLPFANTLTHREKALLGNPQSIYDDQGIYIYRNKRLISWGSWMRTSIRSELGKLARIQVDIPSSLDSFWSLDVKKSSAKIPDKIKQQIKISVEDSIFRSKRTTRFPGVVEQTPDVKVWERIVEHEGKVRYQLNRTMPAILALTESLDTRQKMLFDIALSQIEEYLPKYSIANDNTDSVEIINSDNTEEEQLIQQIIAIVGLCDETRKQEVFDSIFVSESYQKVFRRKDEIRRRIFGHERITN